MPFKKGQKKIGGRSKGTVNEFTAKKKEVSELVLDVFNLREQDPKTSLLAFAKEYPRDFYQIASRLIKTEVTAKIEVSGIKSIIVDRASNTKRK